MAEEKRRASCTLKLEEDLSDGLRVRFIYVLNALRCFMISNTRLFKSIVGRALLQRVQSPARVTLLWSYNTRLLPVATYMGRSVRDQPVRNAGSLPGRQIATNRITPCASACILGRHMCRRRAVHPSFLIFVFLLRELFMNL